MHPIKANAFKNTYRASELVAQLQTLVALHGDLPVVVQDTDTGRPLELGLRFCPGSRPGGLLARFEVCSEYFGRPDGAKPLPT